MQPGAWQGNEETRKAPIVPPARDASASCLKDAAPPPLDPFLEERRELQRVLDHPEFRRSMNLVRFLSYICEKYFEGKAEEIREYSIAVEALGRRESNFDSHVDPIVRVTARSLRKKLNELYATDSQLSPLRIVLPLGHYVPEFVRIGSEANEMVDSPTQATSGETPALPRNRPAWWLRRITSQLEVSPRPLLRVSLALLAAAGIFMAGYFWGMHGVQLRPPAVTGLQWGNPVWADEFNGPSGQLPDPAKWDYDTGNYDQLGNQGWGNGELETYCSANSVLFGCDPLHPNAFLDGDGHLVLRAERTTEGKWTSARISTIRTRAFQYGRIEARMKMPMGKGLWPAFWMLGTDFRSVGWPASGSVSIAENVGLTARSNGLGPSMIRSTLHGPHYSGANGLWCDFKLPNGGRVDDGGFHTYGIIWSPGMMQFYVDDPANVFFVRDSDDLPADSKWVFDHPFFLVMNLAVGGDWASPPDLTTPNPSDLVVDYVRVYNIPKVAAPAIQWHPVTVSAGSSEASVISLQAKEYSSHVHLACSVVPTTATCTLASTVVDFSNTLSQADSVTISTHHFSDQGVSVAPPGRYHLTITATTISGDRSQLTAPFDVQAETR
ncbi:MAG: glycoside hydrolase family 16 protein [Acidobacteriaceae bacterium]